MESTGETISGDATVVRSNAPSEFLMSSRSETSNPAPTSVAPPPPPPPPQNSFALTAPPPATEGFSTGMVKKKRGRPRKYGHDGAPAALSPVPISSAAPTAPHVIDFSVSEKRSKLKPATSTSFIKTNYQADNLGEWAPPLAGANFTPHIITVNAGEDVTKKIISFSQRGSFAVCVLCANGAVSSVTLRQPDSSGGTLTYEGRFEILSLSGSFMPSDSDGMTRSRTGGMTVSLAGPDGRVVGGGVAGVLIAATPIQVVVGSFLAGTNQNNRSFMASPMPTSSNAAADHRTIRPTSSSSPHISTWTPTFSSDPQHKPSHDINVALT